ncbi:HET-domain-containing protein [Corynespora cassiicola Philippines]|uniref:HET-domain-containing protein n=1 Tax=Corynespora cassiicola Philippines TaxID=1448308 RepID=A0A2T2NV90_CORCC|nr:HET-domain-containing protein [Corynespora cassiicola Philippines]
MDWPFTHKQAPTLRLGNRDYLLVQIGGDESNSQISRAQRSKLQKFDDPSLDKLIEYQYETLPRSKKKIRLLQLRSGTIHGSDIYCELVEADYNNSFHIPTKGEYHVPRPVNGRKQSEAALAEECRWVRQNEIKYEALSWCWGTEPQDYVVFIEENGKTYKKRVRKELALALKYLRKPNETRTLWIDAICINQDDFAERNQQVQMMSRIYTRAKEVCIWLGEDTDDSTIAIDFIRNEITPLKNFDAVSSDKRYTEKWQALMMLMQRDWFSRRWVVQEIALAKRATIYCGPDSIPWKEFAVSVELFVEVETATHRLSEVMQKDEKFRHVPGWFEYVSELGASLLVQATGKVFRAQRTPMDDAHADLEDPDELHKYIKAVHTIDPLDRRSLLSLEYLVTTMFIFKATECRDSIYSMLAIARDATPFAEPNSRTDDVTNLTMSMFDTYLAEKPFIVDYNRPYSDVCRDFVEFCIRRKMALDSVQALDILCRPWALEAQPKKSIQLISDNKGAAHRKLSKFSESDSGLFPPAQPSGTLSTPKIRKFKYQKTEVLPNLRPDPRTTDQYWEEIDKRDVWDKNTSQEWKKPRGWAEVEKLVKGAKVEPQDLVKCTSSRCNNIEEHVHDDLELPSWVARASRAPFNLYPHPGMHILKTGRAHADSLVGMPRDGHRNYSAAQTKGVRTETLKFRKRPFLGHYSLYVEGIELDEIAEVEDASQGGNMPKSWLDLGGWKPPYSDDPPAEFWRTIVADRGHENRNPPYYYARACKESVNKGGVASGRVNTTALINNEQNSIIAEFCRRVHAVIWGRSLFKTKKGRLGLATNVQKGDKVCIFYGCTVPVILKKHSKDDRDLEREILEDRFEAFKSVLWKKENSLLRTAKYKAKRNLEKDGEKQQKRAGSASLLISVVGSEERDISEAERDVEAHGTHGASRNATVGRGRKRSLATDETSGEQPAEKKSKAQSEREKPLEDPKIYYNFKGEGYVHGLMDGEALREAFYDDLSDQVFELR